VDIFRGIDKAAGIAYTVLVSRGRGPFGPGPARGSQRIDRRKDRSMARVCSICGKKPVVGHNVSHAHNKSKRLWKPNLQKIHILENGQSVRRQVCTRCLRSGKVQKAP